MEFALVLPILLILTLGLLDFGRATYAYNTVANASRVATRVAIVDQNVDRIRQAAVDAAVNLSTVGVDDVDVSFECTDRIGCLARVEVTYSYSAATPMIEAIVGSIELSAHSEMPIENPYVSP